MGGEWQRPAYRFLREGKQSPVLRIRSLIVPVNRLLLTSLRKVKDKIVAEIDRGVS